MLLFLIFAIFTFFFLLIQEQSKETDFSLHFQQDQLKNLSGFLRTHENYNEIDQETDLGISESFFTMKINLIKNENCVPFDSPYLIYPKLFNNAPNSELKSFLNSSNEIFLNGKLISKYEILYYANFLRSQPSDIIKNKLIILPNTD